MIEGLIKAISLLAEPIALIIELMGKDAHSEDDESAVLYSIQRAIYNERARRREGRP